MAVIYQLDQISFTFPEEKQPVLQNISLQIYEGEFLTIAGPSGCGKSTFLRLLKKEVQPTGTITGEICFRGKALDSIPEIESMESISIVFQDPENQLIMDEVEHELAFPLENLNLSQDLMKKRMAEITSFLGINTWLDKKTHQLSGGQKQLLNLATSLVIHPKVILLDEPTAQLDPIAAKELLQMLNRLNEEFGMTVILIEHRLEDVLPITDRILLMDHGKIDYLGAPQAVMKEIKAKRDTKFISYLPSISQIYLSLSPSSESVTIPITVKEGRNWIRERLPVSPKQAELPISKEGNLPYPPLMELKKIQFQYEKKGDYLLNQVDIQLYSHDFLAIFGGNGTGKSTLLQIMAGLLHPQQGHILLEGKKIKEYPSSERYQKIGYLAQNPMLHFIHDSVNKELSHTLSQFPHLRLGDELENLVKRLGIHHLLERHPHDCSGGEKQKIALAGVLLRKPNILILDEPTKGLDPLSKRELGNILQEIHQSGITLVMVTHDLEFAAQHATRCAMLFQGMLTSQGTPQQFFQENFFYTTTINRMVREVLPGAITKEEVLEACCVPISS